MKCAKVKRTDEDGVMRGYCRMYEIRRKDPPANFENDLAATAIFQFVLSTEEAMLKIELTPEHH